jgi:hypothetical protein
MDIRPHSYIRYGFIIAIIVLIIVVPFLARNSISFNMTQTPRTDLNNWRCGVESQTTMRCDGLGCLLQQVLWYCLASQLLQNHRGVSFTAITHVIIVGLASFISAVLGDLTGSFVNGFRGSNA